MIAEAIKLVRTPRDGKLYMDVLSYPDGKLVSSRSKIALQENCIVQNEAFTRCPDQELYTTGSLDEDILVKSDFRTTCFLIIRGLRMLTVSSNRATNTASYPG